MDNNTVLLEASSLTNIMSEFNYNDDYFNDIPLCKKIKVTNSLQNIAPYVENITFKKIMKIINNMKRAGVTFCVNKSSYDIVNNAIANIGTDIECEQWEHFKKEYDLTGIDIFTIKSLLSLFTPYVIPSPEFKTTEEEVPYTNETLLLKVVNPETFNDDNNVVLSFNVVKSLTSKPFEFKIEYLV